MTIYLSAAKLYLDEGFITISMCLTPCKKRPVFRTSKFLVMKTSFALPREICIVEQLNNNNHFMSCFESQFLKATCF